MMITTRRAADRLEQALSSRDRSPALVQVADAVASLPTQQIAPSADFRATLRGRLDAEMAELSAARTEEARPPRAPATTTVVRVGRKRQVLAGTVAAVLISGTAAAVASTAALPGDLLYPVKRGIEDVRGAVGGDATQAATQLDFARERLSEAEKLVLRGEPGDVEAAEVALRDFGAGAAAGTAALLAQYAEDGDADHLVEVSDFVGDVVPQLERIRVEAPESLHPTIDALLRQLSDVGGGLSGTLASCGQPCADAGITGLDSATGAVLERAGSAPPTASLSDAPAASAAPAAPAVPGAPGAPAAPAAPVGGVQIGDDASVGVDEEGLAAGLPGLDGSGQPGSAGTTGEASVPDVSEADVPIEPDLPIESLPSDPLDQGAVDEVVEAPPLPDVEVPCVPTLLDDCS